jgi:fructose-specific phosphotransferase system IIC component
MKIKFYPTSLISRTKGSFYNSKSYLNYLKKLAQEQGISFLVGIAVGVNLILLSQMSENIINKLSETLTGSIIGIAAIISTVIVGVTIIYIQRKIVRRINKIIEQQYKMAEDENRLDKEMILDYNKL